MNSTPKDTAAAGGIKSAVELAMERYASADTPQVSARQKERLAEIDAAARAKTAEVEILYAQRVAAARQAGSAEQSAEIEQERAARLGEIRAKADREKARVRAGEAS